MSLKHVKKHSVPIIESFIEETQLNAFNNTETRYTFRQVNQFLKFEYKKKTNLFNLKNLQSLLAFSSLLQAACGGSVLGFSSILFPQLEESKEIVLTIDQASWIG